MKVSDTLYISINGVILHIDIEAYRNTAIDGQERDSFHPDGIDYPEYANQFASALEVVREGLLELDEDIG